MESLHFRLANSSAQTVYNTWVNRSLCQPAIEVAERKVQAIQRFFKRVVERYIFVPVVSQVSIDPAKTKCRLNWGTPTKPQVMIEIVLKAFKQGAIRRDEMRKILIEAGWELFESEEKEG